MSRRGARTPRGLARGERLLLLQRLMLRGYVARDQDEFVGEALPRRRAAAGVRQCPTSAQSNVLDHAAGPYCAHGKSKRRVLRECRRDRPRKRRAIRLVDALVKIARFEEGIGRPAEVCLEVRIGDEPAARGADSAESHASHAEDYFERVLRTPE